MPVSADIYGRIQQPRANNLLRDYANVMGIQQAQQQNELGRLKMDEYQRATQERNSLADLYRSSLGADGQIDRAKLLSGAASGGLGAQIPALQKNFADQDKAAADVDKTRAETRAKALEMAKTRIGLASQAFGHVRQNPTPETAFAVLDYLGQNGVYTPEQVDQYKAKVQAEPGRVGEMAEMAFRAALDAKEQLEKISTQNLGGTSQTTGVDPVTGKSRVLRSDAITQSADNLATNQSREKEGAANRSVQYAGQQIQRDRLAFDKAQPKGVLDPERGLLVDPRTGEARPVTLGGKAVGMKEKPMTETQGKANLFGTRMKEAHRIISDLEGKYWPGAVNAKMAAGEVPIVGGVAGYIGNMALSEEGQQAEQAQRDFINAVLRRESGAVISQPEFSNGQKQYFPQPGDSKETIAQKKRNRELAIRGLEVEVPGGFRDSPTLTNPGREGGAQGSWDEKSDPLGLFRK